MSYLYGLKRKFQRLRNRWLFPTICIGSSPPSSRRGSIILFPNRSATLFCGLAGIVACRAPSQPESVDIQALKKIATSFEPDTILEDTTLTDQLQYRSKALNRPASFLAIYQDKRETQRLDALIQQLNQYVAAKAEWHAKYRSRLSARQNKTADREMDQLRDIHWSLAMELKNNIDHVAELAHGLPKPVPPQAVAALRNLNAVLNSIDRLEVRGRDSAGVSLLFIIDNATLKKIEAQVETEGLSDQLATRKNSPVLGNGHIHFNIKASDTEQVTITFTYKIAAEVGQLGDNIRFLRRQIQNDRILKILLTYPILFHTVLSHTRWASVGEITEPNCHPVDNISEDPIPCASIIHVCLNGDIDNYREIQRELQSQGRQFQSLITTDTKIIPVLIEQYYQEGMSIEKAFRMAVSQFEGSHAISMHTDLAPGKLFIAQKGSGQTVFIGIADDHYMPVSEVYGFVEETSRFIKLNGEKSVQGRNGETQGQIFILDQSSPGGLEGISASYYDGTPIVLTKEDIQTTEITSRDIDRQHYPHYFLKEISEAPGSVEKTLSGRWGPSGDDPILKTVLLDQKEFPDSIRKAIVDEKIRRIYFIGQGTAGIAAIACAELTDHYLNSPTLKIGAVKASELSGYIIDEQSGRRSLADTLVVAISQSGTTADTNRTVDMVKEHGAHTLAIVNRRDSDLTFKTEGVLYTSSGRDIEMSVASTKAFYTQIVAGALLGLFMAQITARKGALEISEEIDQLARLPGIMRKIIQRKEEIAVSAYQLANTKTYWAVVGSGPNKAAADEIRIKLSELCYKTISSDYVEDKKHIDLSSEPLIIVCAAGARSAVRADLVKDTAIFNAHKAATVVITDEDDESFGPYAKYVHTIPRVPEHLAPIVNTIAGHLWGYYAARAIHESSRFLFDFRESLKQMLDDYAAKGFDVYEVVLEQAFREKMNSFYRRFRQHIFPSFLGITLAADLTLLLKYLSGRLPVADFELDFGQRGTAINMLEILFDRLNQGITLLTRPIDAIKHQAKTVTVGTSRLTTRNIGILFDALADYHLDTARIINRNILVLRNLQKVVGDIHGAILYRIENLDLLGIPTPGTTITVEQKAGVLKPIPSRVESDTQLKGTKKIIVREGNVYIGKGRKDGRNILVIPVLSDLPTRTNNIDRLLLLNISFKEPVTIDDKIVALGGKFERIRNIVQENSVPWQDHHLELLALGDLFGISAEKIAEKIVAANPE